MQPIGGLIGQRLRVVLLIVVSLLVCFPALAVDHPLRGVALVIGESGYQNLPALDNPITDARAIGLMLDGLGFEVSRVLDGDRTRLKQRIDRFVEDAKDADVAFLYYSGHGIEAGGENYMAPIDADLSTPAKAGDSLIDVQDVLLRLSAVTPITITLLDACRSEAFPPGTMIEPLGAATPLPVDPLGLVAMRGPSPVSLATSPDSEGAVIGFAAAPGQAALDGPVGGDSPYAAALLKHLVANGYSFADVMTMVSEEVYLTTGARQLPWTNSSLRQVLSFGSTPAAADADQQAIADGRRGLLLSIAAAPDTVRKEVESAAQTAGVPMDAIYGLLKALGQNVPTDPGALDQMLAAQTERIKGVMAQESTLNSADPEIVRISGLAQQAFNQGALEVSVKLWEQAKARYTAINERLDPLEAMLKQRRLEEGALLAHTGDAYSVEGDYASAAQNYSDAFAQTEKWDVQAAVADEGHEADMLTALGDQKGDNDALQRAIEAYSDALGRLKSSPDATEESELQNGLGVALEALGKHQTDPSNLEASVAAFRAALAARPRAAVPLAWAKTQTDLGNALQVLGRRNNDAQLFAQALDAFNSALEERSRSARPLDWAATETDLGNALEGLGERRAGTESLAAAVSAYRAALEEYSLEHTPLDWAADQNNLGLTLVRIGERSNDATSFGAAAAAFRATLQVRTRDFVPLDWASAQNNLGIALTRIGQEETGTISLDGAIAAFNAALAERTRDRVPLDWAQTQSNLGLALELRGTRTSDATSLDAGVAALRSALLEQTKETAPAEWAATQSNLGIALDAIGALRRSSVTLQSAVDALMAALEVRTQANAPFSWAQTEGYLGDALADLGKLTHDAAILRRARSAYIDAARGYRAAGVNYDRFFGNRIATVDKSLG